MNNFSWKRILKITAVIILVLAAAGALYFAVKPVQAKILFASVFKDEHQNYLSCEELPFYPQVEKALTEHADVVEKIKQAGASSVDLNEIRCNSADGTFYFKKGEIVIGYHTHGQRKDIEKLIGNNFFGMAYRGDKH